MCGCMCGWVGGEGVHVQSVLFNAKPTRLVISSQRDVWVYVCACVHAYVCV